MRGIGSSIALADESISIFGKDLADFSADIEYMLDAYFSLSLPVNYSLSTGTMDIDYGVGGV